MFHRVTFPLRRLAILVASVSLLAQSLAAHPAAHAATPAHTIAWDSHSLIIDGRRVVIYSGEFHYWRLPSVSGWEDRLKKMKAAGLNAVSIYFDWQYHSPAPGVYDFTGVRDVNKLLDITDKLGLYVLARVGPYMNGEADAGGLPGWLLTKPLYPRSQTWQNNVPQGQYSALYAQYSREWYDHILPIVARHQLTRGGSVLMVQIENEYSQAQGSQQYMQELYGDARADGITVPIFHNDFWFTGDWKSIVDLYGFDSYPYGFSCCHQWWDLHFTGVDGWEKALRGLGANTPMFVSELQGGSFDPWGGKGYDAVAKTLDGDWLSALDESALAQGTTILNTYMFAGGTTWGYMGEPQVYTSYDYGAPIAESGALRPSYYAAHRLALFLQSYGERLAGADASAVAVMPSNDKVVVHTRQDASTGQLFIFVRHGDAGDPVTTRLSIHSGASVWQVPQQRKTLLTVPGHGSAVLTTNTDVGPLHLNYTTSSVLTDAHTAQGHYLVLYGPEGTAGETDFGETSQLDVVHDDGVDVTQGNGELRLNYTYSTDPRWATITTPSGPLHLLLMATSTASRCWYVHNLLLVGPDLVEDNGQTLSVSAARGRMVEMFGAPTDSSYAIDGQITARPDPASGVTLLGSLSGPASLSLPVLSSWKFQAESPEIDPAFDDSTWLKADHAATSNPNVPPGSTLLADDYGFHYGYVWYRGHFTGAGTESGVTITARHSYSVWLNGKYVGGADSNRNDPPHTYADPKYFAFPADTVRPGTDNVISVLTESLGHDEGWIAGPAAQSPQGIFSASLNDSQASISWRIQGNAGGETPADAERGLMNVSGLYGERYGWYLPHFNDAAWQPVSLPDSWRLRQVTAGIGWYRTQFSLNVPEGADDPVGLTIPHASDKAVIWLNGWLIGRYWEQKGPQHTFYLPTGVLNEHGDNVLAVAVWNRGHVGGLTSTPILTPYASLQAHSLAPADVTQTSDWGYWHTQGNRIVDQAGRPVRVAAVNWFGMENRYFVPAGLDVQPLNTIMARIRALGFNCIRLPFSNQLVEDNPVVADHLDANPDLKGLHALDILDRIVQAAHANGLRIILNNGRSNVGTQPQGNGLWYTQRYPESAWIADWQLLARRYLDDPTVVGVDLRNEPHTGPPGPWSVKAYLHQGATWGPYKGKESPATDWRLAAERGGDAVLAVNPHLLILVEGIQLYPDKTWPGGIETYWWGGVLEPARLYPVELSVPHQLVYAPHEYGPLKWQMPFFGPHMSYKTQSSVWEQHWGFLEKSSFPQEAPVIIGEFGTCGNTPTCVQDPTPGSQGLWFSILMQYLKKHPEIGWAFWAVNGTNQVGSKQDHYLLRPDWQTVNLPKLVDTLRDVEAPASPGS